MYADRNMAGYSSRNIESANSLSVGSLVSGNLPMNQEQCRGDTFNAGNWSSNTLIAIPATFSPSSLLYPLSAPSSSSGFTVYPRVKGEILRPVFGVQIHCSPITRGILSIEIIHYFSDISCVVDSSPKPLK